ncbi:MAG: hypothetical protein QF613_03030 [Candidatus Marinimicrobia bacterium]|nr:hypothetical protein [Candidatus Neomarinimicrobiota bacterium]MDP6593168.1 hypothetical protein [Candidatus Neomarinimicrobiota bacterium]MDP6836027.1 hypothetical protein [Candidatus Neomarinimicrobiota bacterium]MDP6967461.1 hypothetical protein [Candidatus Neomarinimicrobiota bacterium]|tara:strand:- start:7086 stop:7583 length:498 start_codon:yes stop_codon:yes gene_type:complete
MENRDKLLILIIIAWIAAGVYFKTTSDSMFARMDEMGQQQLKHVDEVNQEFREDLKTLNLQFIGRGKHLRKAQKDIIANTQLIHHVTDSLSRKIETVQLNLENFSRDTEGKFTEVDKNIEEVENKFNSFKRLANRQIGDIDQRLTTAETDVADLNERVPKKKEKD